MTERLNIVYILTDQHRWDMTGCYGNELVRTPNIDALAAQGVRFDNAFTPSAICTPARASLFTGLFPCGHGVKANPEHGGGAPLRIKQGVKTLVEYLPGYEYFHLGKWHVEGERLPSDFGAKGHDFSSYGFPGSGLYKNFVFPEGPLHGNRYAEWLAGKGFAVPEVSEAFFGNNPNLQCQELRGKLNGPAEASIPHFIVDEGIRLLRDERDAANPFFLWMNFWGPHTPCVIPEPYYSMYPPESIPMDPGFEDGLGDKPTHYRHISQMWGVHDMAWRDWQEIIARYYGYISLIDACIGRFIDCLKTSGLYDRTLIVFTADHGDAMGAHRLIEKGEFMIDETYRIPMIGCHPEVQCPGTTCDEFVYFHDLCATAAEVATGQAPDMGVHSQSILPLMRGEKGSTGRDFVYGEFTAHFCQFPQRMVRTRTHKFIFNAPSRGELYDLGRDPHEIDNLIDSASHAAVKRELIAMLHAQMKALDDPILKWFERVKDFY